MKYYVLKINNKMVRKHEISQDWCDGECDVNMFCTYTDDINLAEKFTHKEIMENLGDIKYLRTYFNEFEYVDGKTKIEDYDFVEVNL